MAKQKLYTLTEEHRAQLKPWADKWIANAMRTGPYAPEERESITAAMRGLYAAANLEAPTREVFAPSPICAAFAAGIASGVWWLREHPEKHHGLFRRSLSEADIHAAMHAACAVADGKAPPVQISAATNDATDAATYAATDAATRDATNDATRDATRAATRAATNDATYAATRDATRDATNDATRDATRDATDAATRDATNDATRDVISFLLACAARSYNMRNSGNQWSGWVAYLSFFRHVAKLKIDYSKWQHYEAAAVAGPRYMHEKFWIVSARPDVLLVDEENRPHCATGPFCRWPDGRELHYWHGVKVPREWIEAPATVDPMHALTWENVEQRRVLTEIIGWGKVLEKLQTRVVHEDADPQIGQLLECAIPDDEGQPGKFLKVRCGTGRDFVLRVPPDVTTATQAQQWLWQRDDYGPEART
jgi:hypothetical protein